MIIIDEGHKHYDGTLQELIERYDDRKEVEIQFEEPVERKAVSRYGEITLYEPRAVRLLVKRSEVNKRTAELLKKFAVADMSIRPLEAREVIRAVFERKKV